MSKITMTCVKCGKQYSLFPSVVKAQPNRQYCSNACRRTRVTRQCASCGKDFEVKPSTVKTAPAKFCSRECVAASPKGVTRPCLTCGKPVYAPPAKAARGHGTYCSMACSPQNRPVAILERFWDKVDRRDPDDCWMWQANKNEDGYGLIRYNRRITGAHRVVLLMTGVEIPKDKEVMHSCDNPGCVNPAHLSLGSHHENILDMVSKGRYSEARPRGQAHSSTKLSDVEVLAIRATFDARTKTSAALAREHGMSTSAMYSLTHRKTWKHLP